MGSTTYSLPPRTRLANARTPPTKQDRSEEELAALLAAILAGHFMAAAPTGSPVADIAHLLRPLIILPGTPGAYVADSVASLAVKDLPERPAASQCGFASLAYVDNLIYRARYAIAAMRRLEAWVAPEGNAPRGERLKAAITRENRHFMSHQDTMRRRVASVKMVEAAVERWGPVLGWRLGRSTEPRPTHKGADGQNFDTRRGVPVSTGGLPGTSPGCMCMAVAPFEGRRMLR